MEWKPISRPQEQFLALPDTIREGFFGGSAGPGKSECLMMYPIVREFYKIPRFKALFVRRTYGELKAEIIPRSRELYTAFDGKFNKSDLTWEFPSGALIFFGHVEHEDDVHKYDSMEVNLFLPDELESFTEFQYLYIGFQRGRSSIPGLPAIIRAAGMPGNIGHTWVKNRFIKPALKGGVVIEGKGGNKRIFIFSTLADNPKVSKEYSEGLEVFPEAEKRAKKYGDWDSYSGQVFEEFRDRVYPDEPENALHVIEPFAIPDFWPKIIVIDWGYHAMTWVGYGAISPHKRLYIYREQGWKRVKIEEWAPFVKEFVDKEFPRVVKVCKSAGQDRGQEHTIQQQISSALDIPVSLTNNSHGSRVAGKLLLHEYLRWKKKYVPFKEKEQYDEEAALRHLRMGGEQGYKSYLARFNDKEEETNIPKLQIFNTCPLLIEAIKAASYDKPKDNKPAEDVAEFDGDDPYDAIRYMVDATDRYFDECAQEFALIQKREGVLREFEEQHDWNKLYRQARILESNRNGYQQPVARYRHHA